MVEVADLVRTWQEEITRLDPRLSDLVITYNHGETWYFTFELGDTYHEVVSSLLETFSFPDASGYFEDEMSAASVPQHVVALFA